MRLRAFFGYADKSPVAETCVERRKSRDLGFSRRSVSESRVEFRLNSVKVLVVG